MFVNSYPTLEVSYELAKDDHTAGSPILLRVTLSRDIDEDEEDTEQSVIAPFYPSKNLPTGGSYLEIGIVDSFMSLRKSPSQKVSQPSLNSRCRRGLTNHDFTLSATHISDLIMTSSWSRLRLLRARKVIVTKIWIVTIPMISVVGYL